MNVPINAPMNSSGWSQTVNAAMNSSGWSQTVTPRLRSYQPYLLVPKMLLLITDSRPTKAMVAAIKAKLPDFDPAVNHPDLKIMKSEWNGDKVITINRLKVVDDQIIPGLRVSLGALGQFHDDGRAYGGLLPYWDDATFATEKEVDLLFNLRDHLENGGYMEKDRIVFNKEKHAANKDFRLATLDFSIPGSFAIVQMGDVAIVRDQDPFFEIHKFNTHLAEWTTGLASSSDIGVQQAIDEATGGVQRVSNRRNSVRPAVVANVGNDNSVVPPTTPATSTTETTPPQRLAAFK